MVEARFFLKNPNLQLRDFGTSDPDTSLSVNVCWSMSRQPVIVTTSAFSASVVIDSGVAGFDWEAVGRSSVRGRDGVVEAAVADGLIRSTAALVRVERSVVEVFLVAAGSGAAAIVRSDPDAVPSLSACG